MTDKDFSDWMAQHVRMTGADLRLNEVLAANRETIEQCWQATYDELVLCTKRMVAGGRVPNYLDRHTNAIFAELHEVRAARQRQQFDREAFLRRTYAIGHVDGCPCPQCNGGKEKPEYTKARKNLKAWLKRNRGPAPKKS